MTDICRTCLEEIGNDTIRFCLNATDFKSTTVGNKLTYCIPEIDLDVVPNAVVCNTCFESLTLAYEFKTKCLKTEGRIQSYIEQTDYVLTCINLRDIAQQQKRDDINTINSHENLDIKNLQCDTKDFFDVPKIAQLLADENAVTRVNYDDSCIHKCSKCDYRSAKRQTLIVHMRKHSDEETKLQKSYKCLLCEYTSSHKSNLRCHLSKRHRKHEKMYKCNFCDYSSNRSHSFIVHLRMHSKTKTYTCMFCQYTSSNKYNFLRHVSVHKGEKILHCFHCGYETITKSDLQVHMRLHTFDFTSSMISTCIDDTNMAVNNVT